MWRAVAAKRSVKLSYHRRILDRVERKRVRAHAMGLPPMYQRIAHRHAERRTARRDVAQQHSPAVRRTPVGCFEAVVFRVDAEQKMLLRVRRRRTAKVGSS